MEKRLIFLIAIKPVWLPSMVCPGDESEQYGKMLLLQDFSFAGFTSTRTHFESNVLGSTSKQNCSHLLSLAPFSSFHDPSISAYPRESQNCSTFLSLPSLSLSHGHVPYSTVHFQQCHLSTSSLLTWRGHMRLHLLSQSFLTMVLLPSSSLFLYEYGTRFLLKISWVT